MHTVSTQVAFLSDVTQWEIQNVTDQTSSSQDCGCDKPPPVFAGQINQVAYILPRERSAVHEVSCLNYVTIGQ